MSRYLRAAGLGLAAGLWLAGPAAAQDASTAAEGDALRVFFETGSAHVGPDQADTLDRAARTFREGDPFVMILTGSSDTVGNAELNLDLSVRRARAVADGLAARGIPVDRLQVLGRGESELAVDTPEGVPEPRNRMVEISWR